MTEKNQKERIVIRVYPDDDLFSVFASALEEKKRDPDKDVIIHDPSGYTNAVCAIATEVIKNSQE